MPRNKLQINNKLEIQILIEFKFMTDFCLFNLLIFGSCNFALIYLALVFWFLYFLLNAFSDLRPRLIQHLC